jgi:hypothetical protein
MLSEIVAEPKHSKRHPDSHHRVERPRVAVALIDVDYVEEDEDDWIHLIKERGPDHEDQRIGYITADGRVWMRGQVLIQTFSDETFIKQKNS